MRAKNLSVHLYQHGGELKVWCVSFDLKGSLPRDDQGRTLEAAVRQKQKEIQKILETVEFPDA
jgi:hypothetical protein